MSLFVHEELGLGTRDKETEMITDTEYVRSFNGLICYETRLIISRDQLKVAPSWVQILRPRGSALAAQAFLDPNSLK